MLRRLKSDVALTIPPKKELIVNAPLTNIQQEIYQALFIRAMEIKSIKHESILVCAIVRSTIHSILPKNLICSCES
jgi:SNF2 family DNA or RNA helicase